MGGGQQCIVHLTSLPQLLILAGKLCHMVPSNGFDYTVIVLILYLFLVNCMLIYLQNSCYMAEINWDFTNKFSIYSEVQKNHPVTRSVQSIRLCSTVLLEQWSSEGLTNIGVPSSCSQSSCPLGRPQVGHGRHYFQYLIALPEDSVLISSIFLHIQRWKWHTQQGGM